MYLKPEKGLLPFGRSLPVSPIIVPGCSRCSDNPENGANWRAEPDKAEERRELAPSVPNPLLLVLLTIETVLTI